MSDALFLRHHRLESVRLVLAAGGGDDPLDNEEQLADQMDSLPFLARFQYEATAEYLAGLFDPVAVSYKVCRELHASQSACVPGCPCSCAESLTLHCGREDT